MALVLTAVLHLQLIMKKMLGEVKVSILTVHQMFIEALTARKRPCI